MHICKSDRITRKYRNTNQANHCHDLMHECVWLLTASVHTLWTNICTYIGIYLSLSHMIPYVRMNLLVCRPVPMHTTFAHKRSGAHVYRRRCRCRTHYHGQRLCSTCLMSGGCYQLTTYTQHTHTHGYARAPTHIRTSANLTQSTLCPMAYTYSESLAANRSVRFVFRKDKGRSLAISHSQCVFDITFIYFQLEAYHSASKKKRIIQKLIHAYFD